MLPFILYFGTQMTSRDNCRTLPWVHPRSPPVRRFPRLPQDPPENAVGRTAIRRMVLPGHVGSGKPGEPAMEGSGLRVC